MNSVLDNTKVIDKMSFCMAKNDNGEDIIAVIRDIFFDDYDNYSGKSYWGKEVGINKYDQPLYDLRPLEPTFDVHTWYFSLFNLKVGHIIEYIGGLAYLNPKGKRKITKLIVQPNGSTGWTANIYTEGTDDYYLFHNLKDFINYSI